MGEKSADDAILIFFTFLMLFFVLIFISFATPDFTSIAVFLIVGSILVYDDYYYVLTGKLEPGTQEFKDLKLKQEEETRKAEERKRAREEKEKRAAEIAERNRITELLTKILKVIQQVTPNIQVQLSRISELSKGDPIEVERLLKTLIANNGELGAYLEFEQVFIRKALELNDDLVSYTVSKITSSRSRGIDGLQTCPNCNEEQSTLIRECLSCKASLPYCNICKRGFGPKESKLTCPHCKNIFHKSHLYAYIQSHGQCAVCREGLTQGQFE